MKKMFFMAAIAALALSSCSSDEIVQGNDSVVEDGAVVFSAHVGRDNRAYDATDITLVGLQDAASPGFGVFAYEHGKTPWNTYNTYNTVPNFMFNEDVKYVSPAWSYEPVKYFSNNEGAQHSFFAYAPYSKDVNTVFSLANGAPAVRYNAADNYDLLWANRINVTKLDVESKVNFAFQHALSKVDFQVTYFVDKVHAGTHPTSVDGDDFKDAHTTVTVRSVKFIGAVPSQGVLNLGTGNWTYEATEEGAYEFAPATNPVSFTHSNSAMEYQNLKQGTLVLPTIAGNDVKVQVVYDVTTIDEENPRNNSTITNTITSKDTEKFALEAGKHYNFKLDLGLTSVKFDVTEVEGWGSVENLGPVDLPNNTYAMPIALTAELSEKSAPTGQVTSTYTVDKYGIVDGPKVKKWKEVDETTPTGAAATEGVYYNGKTVYLVGATEGAINNTYLNVDAYGKATTYYVYNSGTQKYDTETAQEVKSVVPDSYGKIYNTSGTAVGVPENSYLVCDGKLYKWTGTAIADPAPTPSNRR